jgi:hypothetical protein
MSGESCMADVPPEESARLIAMLRRLEWADDDGFLVCQICGSTAYDDDAGKDIPVDERTHNPNCELAALLTRNESVGERLLDGDYRLQVNKPSYASVFGQRGELHG